MEWNVDNWKNLIPSLNFTRENRAENLSIRNYIRHLHILIWYVIVYLSLTFLISSFKVSTISIFVSQFTVQSHFTVLVHISRFGIRKLLRGKFWIEIDREREKEREGEGRENTKILKHIVHSLYIRYTVKSRSQWRSHEGYARVNNRRAGGSEKLRDKSVLEFPFP